ncbi:MAG: glycosyltransferase family 2 protein [Ignavibacteria bacterium]
MASRPVVYVIACCFNEARILPFFLDHYIKYVGAAKVVLYDGGSTDGSAEIAGRYPEVLFKVERSEKLDDRELMRIRNEEWKQFRNDCDWMIVCDVDEFLYCEDPARTLNELKAAGVTLPEVEGYGMHSKAYPEYRPDAFLWQQAQTGIREPKYNDKNLIFDPRVDINYNLGCHSCSPTGPVVRSNGKVFKNFHYSMLSYEAVLKKARNAEARLSDWNLKVGAGFHYKLNAAMSRLDFNRLFFQAANAVLPVAPPAVVTPEMHAIARLLLEADDDPFILELGTSWVGGGSGSTQFYAWFVHNYGGRFRSVHGSAESAEGARLGLGTAMAKSGRTDFLTGSASDIEMIDRHPWDVLHIGGGSGQGDDQEAALQALNDFIRLEPQLAEGALVVTDTASAQIGNKGRSRYLAYYLLGRGFKPYAIGSATVFSQRALVGNA